MGSSRRLPPGSYDLRIGLAQEGFGDFDTDAAEPVGVEVTVLCRGGAVYIYTADTPTPSISTRLPDETTLT